MEYFKSSEVYVFPSAYRSSAIPNGKLANIMAEQNITKLAGLGDGKTSYIISYDNNVLKCVIAGYYFEITTSTNIAGSLYINIQDGCLCKIGASAVPTGTLDEGTSGSEEFVGLAYGSVTSGYTHSLAISAENYLANLTHGTAIDSAKLGTGTTANQASMLAVGKYNTTETGDLFVVGNGTSTTSSNVLQVNSSKVKINQQTTIAGNTTINGTETLSGDLNINNDKFKVTAETGKVETAGNLEIATDKFKVDAANGNTTVAGTLTQGNTTDKQQVTFNGNVDAKNGLDVSGANLTVGGSNFTATTTGNLTAKGQITLGETSGVVTLSKSGSQTEVKGTLKANEAITASSTINGLTLANNTTDRISITQTTGATTTSLTVASGKTVDIDDNVDIDNSLTVKGNTTINTTLTVGGESSSNKTGAVSIYSNGHAATTVYGPNGGEITLPANITTGQTGGNYLFTQKRVTGGDLVCLMTKSTSNNDGGTVVERDANGNFSAGTITANLSGTATSTQNSFKNGETVGGTTQPVYLSYSNGTGTLTACSTYAGGTALTINDVSYGANSASLYAPRKKGTSGAILYWDPSGGGVPYWTNATKISISADDGYITAVRFYAPSDKRLKENIVEYKPEKSILNLPIYKYDYIDGSKNQIGCLAQDLQEICPEIVTKNENGYLSIQESKLVYLLLDEIKELRREIEEIRKER